MAILIRRFLLLLVLSSSISLTANDRFSFFCDIGKTLPLFSYSSATKSDNVIQIAQPTDFAKSFSFGMDLDVNYNYGLTVGILFRELSMDRSKFVNMHKTEGSSISSYIGSLRMHDNLSLYTGIYKEFKSGKFHFYPEFTLGFSSINSDFAEVYYANESNELIHTKKYEFDFDNSIVLGLGSEVDYKLPIFKYLELKLNLRFQLNWQAPKVRTDICETDLASNSIIYYQEEYRQSICTAFFGIGLVVSF